MIKCKRVYAPADSNDGYRVLIDRLWPRGVKKEALVMNEWCKTLAPGSELRKDFHAGTIDFAHFSQRYRQELSLKQHDGERLAELAQKHTVTLLYAAKNEVENHALVLADWLRTLTPEPSAPAHLSKYPR